jgi:hypothetical protein
MRKLLLVCAVIAVAAPAGALAGKRAPGDGTLQVRGGDGIVFVQVRGAVLGRCSDCTLTIDDPVVGDGTGAIVFGEDVEKTRLLTETKTRYVNRSPKTDLRFRIIGGLSKVTINGEGINLSVVGRGFGRVHADVTSPDPGEYAVDGGDFQPLPLARTTVQLGANANSGG